MKYYLLLCDKEHFLNVIDLIIDHFTAVLVCNTFIHDTLLSSANYIYQMPEIVPLCICGFLYPDMCLLLLNPQNLKVIQIIMV